MNPDPWSVPSAPDWHVDWAALDAQFEWIRAMRSCPQDAVHHAEGDVWIHVKLVCETLAALDEWRALPETERKILFVAALLHDVAKPACTRHEEGGRISARGHSQKGAVQARRILWEQGVDFRTREQVCALVQYHQAPFHLIERADALSRAYRISQTARCDLLAILAKADVLGRTCQDQADILLRIGLFRELCIEHTCLTGPRAFPSPLSRFQYFRADDRDPNYAAHDEAKFEVILMSGLPGSGKDTWIQKHAANVPQISLDAIREEIGAAPVGNQGAVLHLARERARELLRRGKGFVWNATNLPEEYRAPLIDLFTAYHARTKIVYVEASHDRLFQQNRGREQVVPESAIERMMERWEVPDPVEAPLVEYWINGKKE